MPRGAARLPASHRHNIVAGEGNRTGKVSHLEIAVYGLDAGGPGLRGWLARARLRLVAERPQGQDPVMTFGRHEAIRSRRAAIRPGLFRSPTGSAARAGCAARPGPRSRR